MNDIPNIQQENTQMITPTPLLALVSSVSKYTFPKNVQILDARNIQVGKKNGTTIGTETTQKLGFYGQTTVQAGPISDPSGVTGSAGNDIEARNAINAILDALQNMGIISK